MVLAHYAFVKVRPNMRTMLAEQIHALLRATAKCNISGAVAAEWGCLNENVLNRLSWHDSFHFSLELLVFALNLYGCLASDSFALHLWILRFYAQFLDLSHRFSLNAHTPNEQFTLWSVCWSNYHQTVNISLASPPLILCSELCFMEVIMLHGFFHHLLHHYLMVQIHHPLNSLVFSWFYHFHFVGGFTNALRSLQGPSRTPKDLPTIIPARP